MWRDAEIKGECWTCLMLHRNHDSNHIGLTTKLCFFFPKWHKGFSFWLIVSGSQVPCVEENIEMASGFD